MNNEDFVSTPSLITRKPATSAETNGESRDQIVLFNVGDSQSSDITYSATNLFKQDFDQDSINYCNFDPYLLSDKRNARTVVKTAGEEGEKADFYLNVYFNGDYFNETSKVTGWKVFIF